MPASKCVEDLVAEGGARTWRVWYIAVVCIALVLGLVRFDAVVAAVNVGVPVEIVNAVACAESISTFSLHMVGSRLRPRGLVLAASCGYGLLSLRRLSRALAGLENV